jgi:hypothetical protein
MARRGHGRGSRQFRGLNCSIGHKPQKANIALWIFAIVKKHRHRGLAVSAGSSKFLQVILDRGWMLPMNDQANIWNI